jgi:hypothetical protein
MKWIKLTCMLLRHAYDPTMISPYHEHRRCLRCGHRSFKSKHRKWVIGAFALCLLSSPAQAGNPISDLVRSIQVCVAQPWACPLFTGSYMSDPLDIGQGYGGRKKPRTGTGGGYNPPPRDAPGDTSPGGTR